MAKKRISTASAKAKGRRLQDFVRDWLRQRGQRFGLVEDDIKSAIMGTSGVDIVLSPAARRVFNLDVECKNVEILNVARVFLDHYEAYKDRDSLKVLVHSKNHSPKMVTMMWDDFAKLYGVYVALRTPTITEGEKVPRINSLEQLEPGYGPSYEEVAVEATR